MTLAYHPMSPSALWVLLVFGLFVQAVGYTVLPTAQHADARAACLAINQKLLTVQSLGEKAALDAFVSSTNLVTDPWIDVTYDTVQQQHVLHTGMPVTWSDWLNMSAPLEPKDATVKKCVKADRDSEHSWHTTYCHDNYWALCGDSGQYFNLSVMSYTEAKAACGAQGSVVAKIENQEQLDALVEVLDNISTSGLVWLGMEYNDTGHVFIDGSDVTWFKWATLDFREPDDLSWKHCVVYDHEYRGWKMRQCTNPAPVICQEKKVTPNYKLLNTDVDLDLTPSSTIETTVPNKCAITCYDLSCTHFTFNGAECRLYAATGVPTQTPLAGTTLWIEDEQD